MNEATPTLHFVGFFPLPWWLFGPIFSWLSYDQSVEFTQKVIWKGIILLCFLLPASKFQAFRKPVSVAWQPYSQKVRSLYTGASLGAWGQLGLSVPTQLVNIELWVVLLSTLCSVVKWKNMLEGWYWYGLSVSFWENMQIQGGTQLFLYSKENVFKLLHTLGYCVRSCVILC